MRELICISIAIDNYDDPNINNLSNSVSDANGFIDVLEKKYRLGQSIKLHDEKATKELIEKEFTNLYLKFRENVDILVLLNGHGFEFNESYYFPLMDSTIESKTSCMSGRELTNNLKFLDKYKNVAVIVNTCESGYLFGQRYFSSFNDKGNNFSRVLFVSSAKSQLVRDSVMNSSYSPFIGEIVSYLDRNSSISELSIMSVIGHTKYDLSKKKNIGNPREGFFDGHGGGEFCFYLVSEENADWQLALNQGDVQAYSDYLSKHRGVDKDRTEISESRLEFFKREVEYLTRALKNINTIIQDYSEYEKEGEFNKDIANLSSRIEELDKRVSGDKLAESEWQDIRTSDDRKVFENFIDRYPDSPFVSIAERILAKIIREQEDEAKWNEVTSNKNTKTISRIGLLEHYIKEFEYGIHSKKAYKLIPDMKAYMRIEKESDETKKVELINSYIDNEEFQEYSYQVNKTLKEIEASRYRDRLNRELDEYIEADDYDKIVDVLTFYEGLNETESEHLSEVGKKASLHIEEYNDRISSEASRVIASSDPKLMYEFINKFSGRDWVLPVQQRFDEIDLEHWEMVNTNINQSSITEFIETFRGTNSSFLEKAAGYLSELNKFAECSTIQDYEYYIDKYGETALHLTEAKERISQLEYEKCLEQDYEKALLKKEVSGYEDFLNIYGVDTIYSDEIIRLLSIARSELFKNELEYQVKITKGNKLIQLIEESIDQIGDDHVQQFTIILDGAKVERNRRQEVTKALQDKDLLKVRELSELGEFKYYDDFPFVDAIAYLEVIESGDNEVLSTFIEENPDNK
ncbi:MAG: hypothetical protein AAFY76_01735, partial [Cyanobacteria bacterium J06649_11]